MTRIDFYILAQQTFSDRQHFACRLTERAVLSGHQVLLYVDDLDAAVSIDDALWGWKPEAFIPHKLIVAENSKHSEPVMIGWKDNIGQHFDILINLAQEVPSGFSRFERVMEIVIQNESVLNQTRSRYKYYKHRGFPINDNDLRL